YRHSTHDIYSLSLHDALPISIPSRLTTPPRLAAAAPWWRKTPSTSPPTAAFRASTSGTSLRGTGFTICRLEKTGAFRRRELGATCLTRGNGVAILRLVRGFTLRPAYWAVDK